MFVPPLPTLQTMGTAGFLGLAGPQRAPPRGPRPRDSPPSVLPAAQERATPRNLLGDAPGRKCLGTLRPDQSGN